MSFGDACYQMEVDARRAAQHETFGHLFPEGNKVFKGKICATISIYGDIIVIDEEIDISGSPWWFASVGEFAYEQLKDLPQGSIHEFEVEAQVVEEKDDNYYDKDVSIIVIKKLSSKVIKEVW